MDFTCKTFFATDNSAEEGKLVVINPCTPHQSRHQINRTHKDLSQPFTHRPHCSKNLHVCLSCCASVYFLHSKTFGFPCVFSWWFNIGCLTCLLYLAFTLSQVRLEATRRLNNTEGKHLKATTTALAGRWTHKCTFKLLKFLFLIKVSHIPQIRQDGSKCDATASISVLFCHNEEA